MTGGTLADDDAEIRQARPHDLDAIRELFGEYRDGLGIDLSFQDFERELAEPFSVYARILISTGGCVALRRIDAETCEMKRLYVRPQARGRGLGRRLVLALLAEARELGYRRMLLDTLPTMSAAHGLYRSLGFSETEAYRHNPVPGASFLELGLA